MSFFRAKSMEKLQDPEQLDDYIRVVAPPAWMTLGAVSLVIIAFVVWSLLGDVNGVTPLEALFG